jgi:superfamily I DNA/RNA helicase
MVDLQTLNPQQRLAVETIKGPVLILAGAGTGKTRVITYRIAHMIDRGISPGSILAVTFTNKAAREMKERVAQLVPRGPRRKEDEAPKDWLTISTFHSLGARILRQYIDRLGYNRNFVIYDDSDQLGVVKKIVSHISAKGEKMDPREILGAVSKLKTKGAPGAMDDPGVAGMGYHVRPRYESALHACNAVDYDDLILLPLKLFKEHPDVLEECRDRFRYVMVDEYQDTNASQFQFVNYLTEKHRNLCVVGDDDQSIYGWRGAEVANLLDLEKYYPEVKVVKLEENYRSTNTILNAANAVIKLNTRRREKKLWSRNGQGEKILIYAFKDEEEEAKTIVEEIQCDRMARSIPWSDHAILFRTNAQSRPLETALRQAGVHYNLIGGQSFFDRREVKDLIAYLKVFINPNDDNSLLRIANVPPRGLSDVTMERLLEASQKRKCSVYAVTRHTDVQDSFQARTREAVADFMRLIDETRAPLDGGKSFSLLEWMERFLKDTGYIDDLRKSEKNVEIAENRVRNLKDLLISLEERTEEGLTPVQRLEEFLEGITLDGDRYDEKETTGDAVTLITTHSCKGLEFPRVHLVGVEDGLLPHSRSAVEGTLEEERRLFYVAITRAKRMLTLSFCQSRKKYGQLAPCHPSRFLKDLPKELVEWADPKSNKLVQPQAGKSLFAAMRAAAGGE